MDGPQLHHPYTIIRSPKKQAFAAALRRRGSQKRRSARKSRGTSTCGTTTSEIQRRIGATARFPAKRGDFGVLPGTARGKTPERGKSGVPPPASGRRFVEGCFRSAQPDQQRAPADFLSNVTRRRHCGNNDKDEAAPPTLRYGD